MAQQSTMNSTPVTTMGISPRKSSLGDMVKAVKQAETLHVSTNQAAINVVSLLTTSCWHQSTSFSEPLYYHLVTLHLFTLNDLKSILIPEIICGILSALSGPLLTTNSSPALFAILVRLPHVVLWNYLNLLIFDLANQRLITSLLEDSFNKPWRPLPSRRLSLVQARRLLLSLIPIVVAATYFLGAVEETVLMLVLTWMYNDLHGADEHYLVRNIINAAGFMCYSSGSTRVAAGGQNTYNLNSVMLYQWTPLVGAVVLSTLQMQDMSDQEGDAQGDRGTLPLIWGDGVARWSIALPVIAWSVVCPMFWRMSYWGYAVPLMMGILLAGRVLILRSMEQDKATWKLWCAWTMSLYALPLCKDYTVFSRTP